MILTCDPLVPNEVRYQRRGRPGKQSKERKRPVNTDQAGDQTDGRHVELTDDAARFSGGVLIAIGTCSPTK